MLFKIAFDFVKPIKVVVDFNICIHDHYLQRFFFLSTNLFLSINLFESSFVRTPVSFKRFIWRHMTPFFFLYYLFSLLFFLIWICDLFILSTKSLIRMLIVLSTYRNLNICFPKWFLKKVESIQGFPWAERFNA